ncbi:RNA-binding protein [Takifugu flavidus]|uniref:RNA-binding protein n=1 Tax=Takifugu flavidus TaxID=433684 RepID=A0A5C6P876_9TELE|nr:RNA-binding protein [Takifugu flavidus]
MAELTSGLTSVVFSPYSKMFIGGLSWQTSPGVYCMGYLTSKYSDKQRGHMFLSNNPTYFPLFTDSLRDYFSKFGEIRECMVMRDPTTKRSR